MTSRRLRLGFGVAIGSVMLFFGTLIVRGTWDAGDYFRRVHPGLPDSGYPVASVFGSCAFLLAEAFVIWRLLTGTSLSIGRALAALGAALGGAGILFFTSMMPDHVPARVTYHFLWLLSAATISLGTLLTLAATHLARLLVGSRQSSG